MAHKSFPSVVSNGNLSDGQLVNSLDPSPESIENLSPLVENQPNLPTSNKIYEHSAILQMNKSSNKEIWGDNMPNEISIFNWIIEIGIPVDAILCIQNYRLPCKNFKLMIYLSDEETLDLFSEKTLTLSELIIENKIIRDVSIHIRNNKIKKVFLSNIPSHNQAAMHLVHQELIKYGKPIGKPYQNCFDNFTLGGQVVYKMEIEKPIPEFFDFKVFKYPINIYYKGQPKSCHYCFEIGHVASFCKTRFENQKKKHDEKEIFFSSCRR